jgi:hypothetical protein
VETVYAKGYDVLVELGAGDARSSAIRDILKGRKHVAVAIDSKGQVCWNHMLRLTAPLMLHCVPGVGVAGLYHPQLLQPKSARHRLHRMIVLNGRFTGDEDYPLASPKCNACNACNRWRTKSNGS